MTKTAKKAAKTATKKNASNKAKVVQSPNQSFRFSTEVSKDSMKESILNHLRFTLARHPEKRLKTNGGLPPARQCVTECWIAS